VALPDEGALIAWEDGGEITIRKIL
jgi:hypothetical protein